MQTEIGRPLYPRGGQQDDTRDSERGGERGCEGTGEIQDVGSATGVLSRIRAILGVEAPPTSAAVTRDKSTEDRRTKREAVLEADVATLRRENSALRRQLAESQGRVRTLKEELGSFAGVRARTEARRETSFAKPYENVTDHDHERVMAFIRKWEMDPNEDYDRALMGLLSKGEVKVCR